MTIEEKHVLRTQYKQKIKDHFSIKSLAQFDIQKKEEESLKLVHNLKRILFSQDCRIAGYQALPEEPSLNSFYKDYKVAFPFLEEDGMSFYYPLYKEAFKKNKFSIPEPNPEESKKANLEDIDVFFIPGSVFDRSGRRIGRGKAYYDRVLSQISALKIGVAWSFQLHSSSLPTELHDVPMDFIVTEKFICIPSLHKNKGLHQFSERFITKEIDQKNILKRSC